MIIQALLNFLSGLIASAIDLIEDLPPAVGSLMADVPGAVEQILGALARLEPWVPFSVLTASLNAVIGAWLAAIVIRLIRAIISYGTGGGGA